MTDDLAEILADDVEPADLDPANLVALIEAARGSLDGFLDEPAARDHIDAHDIQPAHTRPDALAGTTQRIATGYDHIYVNINTDTEGQPVELFTTYGKSGGFTRSFTEAIQNLATLALREHIAPKAVVAQLRGIRSPRVGYDHGTRVDSIPDAIGLALERVLDENVPRTETTPELAAQTGLNPVVAGQGDPSTTSDDTEDTDAAASAPSDPSVTVPPDTPEPEPDATDTSTAPADGTAAASDGDPQGVPGATPGGDPHVDIDPDQHGAEAALPDDPEPCPECGSLHIAYAEGCQTCQNCGWSECS